MNQPYLFTPPIQQQGSLRSRHASAEGAKAAGEVVGRQMIRILEAYRKFGPMDDLQVERATGIQRSSVIPRRRKLMEAGLVVELGSHKSPFSGRTNTVYGLPGQETR